MIGYIVGFFFFLHVCSSLFQNGGSKVILIMWYRRYLIELASVR